FAPASHACPRRHPPGRYACPWLALRSWRVAPDHVRRRATRSNPGQFPAPPAETAQSETAAGCGSRTVAARVARGAHHTDNLVPDHPGASVRAESIDPAE